MVKSRPPVFVFLRLPSSFATPPPRTPRAPSAAAGQDTVPHTRCRFDGARRRASQHTALHLHWRRGKRDRTHSPATAVSVALFAAAPCGFCTSRSNRVGGGTGRRQSFRGRSLSRSLDRTRLGVRWLGCSSTTSAIFSRSGAERTLQLPALNFLLGTREATAMWLASAVNSILGTLAFFWFVSLRVMVRNCWPAALFFVLIATVPRSCQ
jgi:hypothetical protein